MCGIVGLFSRDLCVPRLILGLKTLEGRGRDGYGIVTNKTSVIAERIDHILPLEGKQGLGHCLHAVIKHIPQPISGKGHLVTNCEIYNWRELGERFDDPPRNDSETLLQILDSVESITPKTLDKIDGDYAFAYWRDDTLWIARDIIGVKPIWYAHESDEFAFASERKALVAMGFSSPQELNPRRIMCLNLTTLEVKTTQRPFFEIDEIQGDQENQLVSLQKLLQEAIRKRIPDVPFGLLFSGGIDSIVLAKLLQEEGIPFKCFVVGLGEESEDIKWSRKAAKCLDLDLVEVKLDKQQIFEVMPQIIALIEEATVFKVEVAIPLYIAITSAKEHGCKVIFSGMGADELFGGYYRQRFYDSLKFDCLSLIRGTYERNTYRDDVISMSQGVEMRVPYLDRDVVAFSLRLPVSSKLRDGVRKFILRKVGEELGIPKEFIWRPKKATQYGTGVSEYLRKEATSRGISRLEMFRPYLKSPLRVGVLFSTGKDSAFAMHVMRKRGYEISCLITIESENPESYMFHTPAVHVASLQAESLGLPLISGKTEGIKEHELKDLRKTLDFAKKEFKLDGVVTGALYSNYQRNRIENIADEVGLKCFSPLWHIDQEQEMRQLIREGFSFVFTAVAAYGLDKTWLGRIIQEKDIDQLVKLEQEVGINIAGEGGEFESLVLNMPGFSKPLSIINSEIIEYNQHSAVLEVEVAFERDKK